MDKPPANFATERMPPLMMFFSFSGRITRREFWQFGVGVLLGLAMLGHALLGIAQVHEDLAERLVNVALLWPFLAVSAKRWHDRDRSAWWVLLSLVPVVGWIWALADNGFVPGTPGANRYGDDTTSL